MYFKDLEEYTNEEIVEEYFRRQRCIAEQICYYCGRPLEIEDYNCKIGIHKMKNNRAERLAEYLEQELYYMVFVRPPCQCECGRSSRSDDKYCSNCGKPHTIIMDKEKTLQELEEAIQYALGEK